MIAYLPEQTSVLLTLARAALTGLTGKNGGEKDYVFAAKEYRTTVSPPSARLVADYVKSCGGNPADYRDTLPCHLFPQWGFPALMQTLSGLPFALTRIVNGGCTLTIGNSLRREKNLEVTARLTHVDQGERRVILTQEIVTRDSTGNSIKAQQISIVRRGDVKTSAEKPRAKEDVLIPENAREVSSFFAHERSGLEYAFFSGDFNPIHWLKPYAQAAGFRRPILHGFAQLGRVYEGIRRNIFCGKIDPIAEISIRFERPLVLPQACRVYLTDEGKYFIGAAPGALAFASGTIKRRDTSVTPQE